MFYLTLFHIQLNKCLHTSRLYNFVKKLLSDWICFAIFQESYRSLISSGEVTGLQSPRVRYMHVAILFGSRTELPIVRTVKDMQCKNKSSFHWYRSTSHFFMPLQTEKTLIKQVLQSLSFQCNQGLLCSLHIIWSRVINSAILFRLPHVLIWRCTCSHVIKDVLNIKSMGQI